jgi:hypothetical protein
MITNRALTMIVWNIVRDLIANDPDSVVHEIIEILTLGTKNEKQKKQIINDDREAMVLDQQVIKELNMKCFNSKKTEFEEIEMELQSKHKSCLINNFEEIDANLSLDELACKIECPRLFINS